MNFFSKCDKIRSYLLIWSHLRKKSLMESFIFLCSDIDVSSKYAWVAPLKDRKGLTIASALQKILIDFKRKPNKIWAHKGSEFYT